VDAVGFGDVRILIGEHMELAPPGAHLVQIGLQLLEQRVLRRDRDDRHAPVDQRERPVLELSRRVGFRVEIGDFLELERTLHRDRPVNAAAEKQRALALREFRRPRSDLGLLA